MTRNLRCSRKKKFCQREHFKRRMRERYGVRISDQVYKQWLGMIRNGGSICLLKQSHTRSLHLIRTDIGNVYVVYDKSRKEFCTALTKDQALASQGV